MSNILVVDDDRVSRTLMSKVLETANFTCLTAASGEEAFEILLSHQVSVLVTDLRMPGMDGLELFNAARKERSNLRGVLCSAYVSYDVITDIMESGLDDCLMKPVQGETLLASVSRSLEIVKHWRGRVAELRKLNSDNMEVH